MAKDADGSGKITKRTCHLTKFFSTSMEMTLNESFQSAFMETKEEL